MRTLTAFTSQRFHLYKYLVFLKDYRLLIISNIRYSKRYTLTDNNDFFLFPVNVISAAFTIQRFQGLSLITSTNKYTFTDI